MQNWFTYVLCISRFLSSKHALTIHYHERTNSFGKTLQAHNFPCHGQARPARTEPPHCAISCFIFEVSARPLPMIQLEGVGRIFDSWAPSRLMPTTRAKNIGSDSIIFTTRTKLQSQRRDNKAKSKSKCVLTERRIPFASRQDTECRPIVN